MSRQLWVKGGPIVLESKPLDVLLHLLLHAGEVVIKEELLEAVWHDEMVVEGSLPTAISKLRKALGEEERSIIVTVPRVGYRIAVPVHCKMFAGPVAACSGLKTGAPVPNREQWQLNRPLDANGSSGVWLAIHPETGEQRVFKFASDVNRLKSLKHKITVNWFLKESLGDRPDFVRILEWNLDTQPFFIESEYAGQNLLEWAAEENRLASMSIEDRLKLISGIVQTVAAAHSVGVLHKDLEPANILVVRRADGGWQTRIADFGSPSLFDPWRLQALGITNLGITKTVSAASEATSGAAMYVAPEVLAGQSFGAAADVYSLGVILYQALVGDFKKPLAAGWDEGIFDSLLRDDIAGAVSGDPAKRIPTAMELAERLRNVEERRAMRCELDAARVRMVAAERRLAQARSRRPWIVAASLALAAGLAISVFLYSGAVKQRNSANQQTAIADAINAFLTDDLIGRSDPFTGGASEMSLADAIHQAMPNIDREFQNQPLIAARLHQTLARAFDNRTDYAEARNQYAQAAVLFKRAEGELSQDGIIVQLQRAAMESRSNEAGALPLARSIVETQQGLIGRVANPRPDVALWNASAKGMIALTDNDAKAAAMFFEEAMNRSADLRQFDPRARLALKQQLAFCYLRMGDGEKAEELVKELIVELSNLAGPESPSVLRARLNLAQAYMIGKKHEQAIKEANAIYPEFVSRLGPDHELTLQLLTARAQSEGSLGMWDASIQDYLAINAAAVKQQGPLSFSAIETLSEAALAQCRAGHMNDGAKNARIAYEASARAFGARSGLTGGSAHTLASCLTDLNQLNDAAALLDHMDVTAVAQLAGDSDFGAKVKLLLAEIAKRQGDAKKLKSLLAEIRPVFTRADADEYEKRKFQSLDNAPESASKSSNLVRSEAWILMKPNDQP